MSLIRRIGLIGLGMGIGVLGYVFAWFVIGVAIQTYIMFPR